MLEAGPGVSILAELVLHRTATVPAVSRTLAIGYQDKHRPPIASKYFIEYMRTHAAELA